MTMFFLKSTFRWMRSFLALGLLCFPVVASATTVYTTIDDFAQFQSGAAVTSNLYYSDSSTVNGIGNSTNPGGTGGVGSLELTAGGGWNQWMSGGELPGPTAASFGALSPGSLRPWSVESGFGPGTMIAGSGTITFDVYTGNLPSWNQFGVTLNYDSNYHTFHWNSATDFTGADGRTWKHVEVPYTTNATALTYFGMAFAENSDGVNAGAKIYIDNLQLPVAVPEPATLLLLVSCVLGCCAFRSQRIG